MNMEFRCNNHRFELIMKLLIELDVLLKIVNIYKIDNDFYSIFIRNVNRIEYLKIKNITNIPKGGKQ